MYIATFIRLYWALGMIPLAQSTALPSACPDER